MARLLVEDDPGQLELRRLILEQAGHEVRTASDGRRALEEFTEAAPAVVVMDLRLPRTEDGLALLAALRARDASVRIVVLTGAAEIPASSAAGGPAVRCLKKPVPSEELLCVIEKLACTRP